MLTHVLDDFAVASDVAASWSVFTDRVMGGVSNASAAVESVAGRRALRLRGTVSLANNGGFVQVARPLGETAFATIDASAFAGLALSVCGAPGSYFVHLRTADTHAPWQYYSAPVPVVAAWTDVTLDWAAFTPNGLGRPLDAARLLRVGIVAARAAFEAYIAIARLALV